MICKIFEINKTMRGKFNEKKKRNEKKNYDKEYENDTNIYFYLRSYIVLPVDDKLDTSYRILSI